MTLLLSVLPDELPVLTFKSYETVEHRWTGHMYHVFESFIILSFSKLLYIPLIQYSSKFNLKEPVLQMSHTGLYLIKNDCYCSYLNMADLYIRHL